VPTGHWWETERRWFEKDIKRARVEIAEIRRSLAIRELDFAAVILLNRGLPRELWLQLLLSKLRIDRMGTPPWGHSPAMLRQKLREAGMVELEVVGLRPRSDSKVLVFARPWAGGHDFIGWFRYGDLDDAWPAVLEKARQRNETFLRRKVKP
jgi:hypothetical protein